MLESAVINNGFRSSIPQPKPEEFTADAYLWLSRQHLHKARNYVATEDLMEATDNLDEGLQCAIKAIAINRDWRHDSEAMQDAVVSQLAIALRPSSDADILRTGRAAGKKDPDICCKEWLYEDLILYGIDRVAEFQDTIERLVDEPPKPFTISGDSDAHRIGKLTGYRPDLGVTDALGFANFTGEVR